MQALILAAGRGSRLGSLTADQPKCLLKLGETPLLVRQIEMLQGAGIQDVLIVTGYRREMIELAIRRFRGVRTLFNPFWPLTNVISSAWMGMRELVDSFIYLHADTIFTPMMLENLINSKGDLVLPYDRHECADEEMKVRFEKGRLVEINKTMDARTCDGEFLGVCRIDRAALDRVRSVVEEELDQQRFQSFFEAVIQVLVDRRLAEVIALEVTGQFWKEIDTEEDLQRARSEFEHA